MEQSKKATVKTAATKATGEHKHRMLTGEG